MIEEYNGYKIWQNTKTVWHKNKVSGHEWSTQEPMRSFYISGPGARVLQWFFSIKKCKEYIDFLISVERRMNEVRA